jgi:predicted transcriptional regulator
MDALTPEQKELLRVIREEGIDYYPPMLPDKLQKVTSELVALELISRRSDGPYELTALGQETYQELFEDD